MEVKKQKLFMYSVETVIFGKLESNILGEIYF